MRPPGVFAMRKIDNLECYRVFCSVAACGSVRDAGAKLSQEPSNIFRVLRQLEKELGIALFERESRPMRLTQHGAVFYEHAQRMIREQSVMLEALRENLESEAGLIQVASTAGARRQILAPALAEYQAANPGISVELREMVSGGHSLFVAPDGTPNDIVLVFKSDLPVPEGTHVEELMQVPFIACASPIYLKRHGTPESPAACAAHKGILLRLPGRSSVTHLSKDGVFEEFSWKTTSTYNSQLDAIEVLTLGGGICPDVALPYFVEEHRKGHLAQVFPGWSCPSRTACLYVSEHAYRKRRVRLFVEWFAERYKAYIGECLKEFREIGQKA